MLSSSSSAAAVSTDKDASDQAATFADGHHSLVCIRVRAFRLGGFHTRWHLRRVGPYDLPELGLRPPLRAPRGWRHWPRRSIGDGRCFLATYSAWWKSPCLTIHSHENRAKPCTGPRHNANCVLRFRPNKALQRTLRVTRFARPLVPLKAKSLGDINPITERRRWAPSTLPSTRPRPKPRTGAQRFSDRAATAAPTHRPARERFQHRLGVAFTWVLVDPWL